MDLQFLAVLAIVVIAALYAGRAFVRQFYRGEDEAEGCAGCQLREQQQRRRRRGSRQKAASSERGEPAAR